MDWIKAETANDIKPEPIDDKSSKKVVFIRKDFQQAERTDIDGNTYMIWTFLSKEIPKEDWELYKTALQNTSDINDLTDAVIELAGILGGE